MRFFFQGGPNQPFKAAPARADDPRVLECSTGDAGKDGYTRLSAADRETGYRKPVGTPADAGPRYED